MPRAAARFFPVAMLALGASLSLGSSCKQRRPDAVPATMPAFDPAHPTLRVYFLVELDGYLEPCGCQRRPLGGIDRMARLIEQGRAQAPRSVLVAAGDLFFNEPRLDARMSFQERAKAEALTGILDRLGLVGFAPGPSDFALGAEAWRALTQRMQAPALAANAGMRPSVIRDVGGVRVGIVGVSDFRPSDAEAAAGSPRVTDAVVAARTAVSEARRQGAQLVVVLASVHRRVARSIAESVEGADFVVAAREESTTPPPPERIGRGWLVTATSQGRGLGMIDLYVRGGGAFADASDASRAAERASLDRRIALLRDRVREWDRDPATDRAAVNTQRTRLRAMEQERAGLDRPVVPASGSYFQARSVEVAPEVEKVPAIQAQIATYFREVNEHNHTEYASLRAPEPTAGQPRYVGGEQCVDCHEEAQTVWRGTPHSHAYRTLVDISKEFNLSCVGCHVTGYRAPGGSEVVQNEGLRDVQCETCHGPGSAHIAARGDAQRRATIRRTVTTDFCAGQCHTPEHSDRFLAEAPRYLERVLGPGHGRPVGSGDAGAPRR